MAEAGWSLGRACAAVGALAAAAAAGAAASGAWRRRRRSSPARSQRWTLPFRRGICLSEVSGHCRIDDAWVVINGQVYDVTSWLQDFPMGQLLLLAYAGRDATELFDSMDSLPIRRNLRRLHIGAVQDGPPTLQEERRAKEAAGPRKASLTGGRKASKNSAAEDALSPNFSAEEEAPLWEVKDNGFLPCRDPVGVEALGGTAFEAFTELASLLPTMCLTGELRPYLNSNRNLQERLYRCGDQSVIDELSEDQLERAFAVVGYTMVTFWRGGTLAYSKGVGLLPETSSGDSVEAAINTVPEFLARPMLALSKRLERPPMIDYAATVLYNWTRIDPEGPILSSNIRCVLRLTGLGDEEWFFKTHVVIESEAALAISAMNSATDARSDASLLHCLAALEEALWRVVRACLPIMYERSEDGLPKCSEHIFYQILRPLIKSGTLAFEGKDGTAEYKLPGPSGAMSSLMPCVDACLGIQTTSPELRQQLLGFELSMPKRHQHLIASLRRQQPIRERIALGRLGCDVPSEQHEALVRAYNRCIARVLDFRWQHWQYVNHFIMKPGNLYYAVGSGGTTFAYLQQHITDTEKARLAQYSDLPFQRMVSPMALMGMSLLGPRQPLEFWSVDGPQGLLGREPLASPDGAWAQGLPKPLREALGVVWDTARRMPALVAARGPFHDHVQALEERLAVLQDHGVLLQLPEAVREHLMATLSHVAAGCIGAQGLRRPPRCIEHPLQVVAHSVGRPARLDFTELVLNNWEQVPVAGNCTAEATRRRIQIVLRFLGTPDEECYRTLHVLLHRGARELVAAIRRGQCAMRERKSQDVIKSLTQLALWLGKSIEYFDQYFDQKDSRTESVMIRRLEPFISHSSAHDLTWQETACWCYWGGSSVILPVIHKFLGIPICTSAGTSPDPAVGEHSIDTDMAQMLDEMRMSMPLLHRSFLEELDRPSASVRYYCLWRFGQGSMTVQTLHDLEAAYNDALNALLRFRSTRTHLVVRFFPALASKFGTFTTKVEGEMRRQRLQLLKMQQRVHRCLEK